MYAQLGTIIFETLVTFDSMDIGKSANYAEHALIEGKPRLQAVGDNLDEIGLSFKFHASFCDPQEQLNQLEQYLLDREVLPLVSGAGRVYGNFVITDLKQNILQTADDGTVIEANCEISLKEYVTDELLEEKKKQKIANAPGLQDPTATRVVKPNRLQLSLTKAQLVSETKMASMNVTRSISEARQVNTQVSRAKQGLISVQKTLKDAKKAIDKVNQRMDEVKTYVNKYRNAYSNFQAILNNADQVKQSINTMGSAIITGDINNVFDANTNFQLSINNISRSGASIARTASMRIPVKP